MLLNDNHIVLLNDHSLSFSVRGMLMSLLSFEKPRWSVKEIMDEGGVGTEKAKALISKAVAAGYMKLVNERNNGRFDPHYVVYEIPIPVEDRVVMYKVIGTCAYCGKPATTYDHVFPLSRGGPDTEDNIVPACLICNSKKGDRTPQEAGMVVMS